MSLIHQEFAFDYSLYKLERYIFFFSISFYVVGTEISYGNFNWVVSSKVEQQGKTWNGGLPSETLDLKNKKNIKQLFVWSIL